MPKKSINNLPARGKDSVSESLELLRNLKDVEGPSSSDSSLSFLESFLSSFFPLCCTPPATKPIGAE